MGVRNMLFRKKPIPQEDIEFLIRYLLEPEEEFLEKFSNVVGEDQKVEFWNKDCVYRLALAMVCIVQREQKEARFKDVRKIFEEKVIFPFRHKYDDFEPLFTNALRDVVELHESNAPQLTWARRWFSEIGVPLNNPIDLSLFVSMWKQRIFFMQKIFSDIQKKY